MTNKDTKRKQKLASEFARALKNHKTQVIMYALVRDEKLYDTKYFKRYKDMEVIAIQDYEDDFDYDLTKVYRVNEDLERRTENGEPELYDQIYKFCWNRIKPIITDRYRFNDREN